MCMEWNTRWSHFNWSNFYKRVETPKGQSTKNIDMKDGRCSICYQERHIARNCPQNNNATPKTSYKAKKYLPKSRIWVGGQCLDEVKFQNSEMIYYSMCWKLSRVNSISNLMQLCVILNKYIIFSPLLLPLKVVQDEKSNIFGTCSLMISSLEDLNVY